MNQYAAAPFMLVDAWNEHAPVRTVTRYPAEGSAYPLREWSHIGGFIGLNPKGPPTRGVATFFWTRDPEGLRIVGVQGMHLTSQIVSNAELRTLGRGPYLYVNYESWMGPDGPDGLATGPAADLYGTNAAGAQPYLIGDTILITERDRPLAAATSEAIYPCDYFAGEVQLSFSAPAGVFARVYAADLTDVFYPLGQPMAPGEDRRTIVPMGTWMVVTSNPTGAPIAYTLVVTPRVG